MIIALTGTPGTGKTSISKILHSKGFEIVDLNRVACEKGLLIGKDEKRDSNIVDVDRFNGYVTENYARKDIVFIEGHLAHLLRSVDKIFVLRCHPSELRKNLSKKGWNNQKIEENVEAEILDIILCETLDIHAKNNIFEINVSGKPLDEIVSSIFEIINNKFKNLKKYNIGKIDWSEEILKDFK
jgi:adenylate kinase